MSMKTNVVATTHGDIAVAESSGTGPAVLLIHGNSSCKEVFRHQLEGSIGRKYRVIALDLPGHGKSGDAKDAKRSYCMPGYADMAVEVLGKLGVAKAGVLGWSLGGHIAIEMISRYRGLAGLLVTGTPPVSKEPGAMALGFKPSPHMNLAGQEQFSAEEADAYAHHTCGVNAPFEPFLLQAVTRTDGRARRMMFEAFLAGIGDDQKQIVETAKVPLAVVSGGDEPFVNNEFLATIKYANLWDGALYILPGVGHAPFWEASKVFDPIFERFLASIF